MELAVFLLLAQAGPQAEGQPLAANVERLVQALDFLGAPLAPESLRRIKEAGLDPGKIEQAMDPHVHLKLALGPAPRLARGAAPAVLQQAGYTALLVQVSNPSGSTGTLHLTSPQAGPVYAGVAALSLQRQAQTSLRANENAKADPDRFLELEMYGGSPMTPRLSGLGLEYALALFYSSQAGARQARIDLEGASLLLDLEVRPALPVKLAIRDVDGAPSTARLVFRDRAGHVYPPQPKRLAPDLFFQKQIYRQDGQEVLLPPGALTMESCRGPEYRRVARTINVRPEGPQELRVDLERWIWPQKSGFYSGDHHIHAAGCAHYSSPTQGIHASDLLSQVKGEGLNVGSVLTWGPCFDYQSQFLRPTADPLSEPLTIFKYDIEVSGFGSEAFGHVCLLNLKDPVYPGSEGAKLWPRWTTPVLRWAKRQGAVTGYAHSASGLEIHPARAARRMLESLDRDKDGRISRDEAEAGLLPEDFRAVDRDGDGFLTEAELVESLNRVADRLPNLAVPELNSVGAQEIFVTAALGLCDFISAMDTPRIAEWNCWYHLMNCGFPVKVSGETDFPCMSGTRVGQGRVYVQLGAVKALDYGAWCRALAEGRSYVSDGYAHALEFAVEGKRSGEEVSLGGPAEVQVRAIVAFGDQTPQETPYGRALPPEGPRAVGDTVTLHPGGSPHPEDLRRVELVVNGRAVSQAVVPGDSLPHEVGWRVRIDRSSWVAIRQFPQLHTNPVIVRVGGAPVRASVRSARWCMECIEQLWRVRGEALGPADRAQARRTFDQALEIYRAIASESPRD